MLPSLSDRKERERDYGMDITVYNRGDREGISVGNRPPGKPRK
jgi:hypothetical protein